MARTKTRASGEGRKMFLTSPYIDQAFTLRTPVVSVIGIFRQLTGTFRRLGSTLRVIVQRWAKVRAAKK